MLGVNCCSTLANVKYVVWRRKLPTFTKFTMAPQMRIVPTLAVAACVAGVIWGAEQLLFHSLAIFGSGNVLLAGTSLLIVCTACTIYLRYVYSFGNRKSITCAIVACCVSLPFAYIIVLPALDRVLRSVPTLAASGELANCFLLSVLCISINVIARFHAGSAWLRAGVAFVSSILLCIGFEIGVRTLAPSVLLLQHTNIGSGISSITAWCIITAVMVFPRFSGLPGH